MKIFISYSHKDFSVAYDLNRDLRACGIDVWLDEHEIKVGDSIPFRISQGLKDSQYVVFLMSSNSVHSPWVGREWLSAIMRDIAQEKTFLLPVLLDDCEIPAIIQDKLYADFRKGYLSGLSQLISVFAEQLIQEQCLRTNIANLPISDFVETLKAISDKVRSNDRIAAAFLLNTIFRRLNPKIDYPPKWLVGDWRSTQGWNEGNILRCTSKPHEVYSSIAYGYAIGSFQGHPREGIIEGISTFRDDVLLFRWYQETGGSMSGAVGDNGWGFWMAKSNYRQLDGLWWYDSMKHVTDADDPKLRAYFWELERMEDTHES